MKTRVRKKRRNLPPWLSKRLPPAEELAEVRELLADLNLATVCQEAHCPNLCNCFARGTATFMILGSNCTRNCSFCAVHAGAPDGVDPEEPGRVAHAARYLKLDHVVVTSVTRDDLPDGGSGHFAATIGEIRERCEATVEVLTPDFLGRSRDIDRVIDARPDVFNHNVETVPRLYEEVRPQADYKRSLAVINRASEAGLTAKSGIMLGLGEERQEVLRTLEDLRDNGCHLVTMGQYLQPSKLHHPVERFVPPEEFEELKEVALDMGFKAVASGPFVRSSYKAGEMLREAVNTRESIPQRKAQ